MQWTSFVVKFMQHFFVQLFMSYRVNRKNSGDAENNTTIVSADSKKVVSSRPFS